MGLTWVLILHCLRNEGTVRELQLWGPNYNALCSGAALPVQSLGGAGPEMGLRLPGQGRGRGREGSWVG